MKYEEYRQLRLYARYDGIYLAVLLVASFAASLFAPEAALLGEVGGLLLLSAPFFVAYRLRKFRNDALDGIITFKRALLYCFRVFINGTLLFAILQWLYLRFVDSQRFVALITSQFESAEYRKLVESYGVSDSMLSEVIASFQDPLTAPSLSLIYGIIGGIVVSFIIAAVMAKTVKAS